MHSTSATRLARAMPGLRLAAWTLALPVLGARPGLAWGPEAHRAVVILAREYLRPGAAALAQDLVRPDSLETASLWADEIAHSSRPDTAAWHYINIPLSASSLNLDRDCPRGDCLPVKTREFLATLGNRSANAAERGEALRFLLHFIADLHEPLHCEDHRDHGGNTQSVVFEGRPDNLHWVWDTGLVEEIDRDPGTLAAHLARRITRQDLAAWQSGSVEDWVLESHRLAQTVAYRKSWTFRPPVLDRAYDQRAEAVIEVQLEKAAVRLAYVLNQRLR